MESVLSNDEYAAELQDEIEMEMEGVRQYSERLARTPCTCGDLLSRHPHWGACDDCSCPRYDAAWAER